MVVDECFNISQRRKEGRKEMFYLTMYSTHFIYGYMVSDNGKEPFRLQEMKPAATTWATPSD